MKNNKNMVFSAPIDLLEELDKMCKILKVSRSRFIQSALGQALYSLRRDEENNKNNNFIGEINE